MKNTEDEKMKQRNHQKLVLVRQTTNGEGIEASTLDVEEEQKKEDECAILKDIQFDREFFYHQEGAKEYNSSNKFQNDRQDSSFDTAPFSDDSSSEFGSEDTETSDVDFELLADNDEKGEGEEKEENVSALWVALMEEHETYCSSDDKLFRILGTSVHDKSCSNHHVLTPPLMEGLTSFFPFCKSSDNFWLKYSLVRDGASMHKFRQSAYTSKHSVLAIETVDGEVFGVFASKPWRKSWGYYGDGETFLWKMRHSRKKNHFTSSNRLDDAAQKETEIEVYPYAGDNEMIQICNRDKIAVGGGSPEKEIECYGSNKRQDYGYGLFIDECMTRGTSSPCLTFRSPSLSATHSDGTIFEICNIELWCLTPCAKVEEAEQLELCLLQIEGNHPFPRRLDSSMAE